MSNILRVLLISINILLTITLISSQATEGDLCTLDTGATGVCRKLPDCWPAIEQYHNDESPVRCGFTSTSPFHEIVCCPISEKVSVLANSGSTSRISQEKCLEYSKLTYGNLTTLPTGETRRKYICEPDEQVYYTAAIGGEDASPKEFPHMAILGYADGPKILWGCGGTLLSERYILTAAHCLNQRDYGPVKIARLGDLVLDTDTDESQPIDIPIIKLIKHPNRDSTKYNDIALLQLRESVKFNDFIRPACLPNKFQIPNVRAWATGWGQTEWGGGLSNALIKVPLYFSTHQECKQDYSDPDDGLPFGIRDETQACAESIDDEIRDTCPGDSGGPIQIDIKELKCMHTIVGVTSFGRGCGGGRGVYTRVYPYLDWIESIVWPNQ